MGIAECIDIEDVDVGGCEKDVLEELEGSLAWDIKSVRVGGTRTEVNMCHGSKNIREATSQRM